jgi:GT2 family glycosyltransferase
MHYDLLQEMLNSVDVPVDKVIIIDNGGKLTKIECVQASSIEIVSLPSNLGVAASWNLGIKLTPFAKWWLIANDDIIWNPGKLASFARYIRPSTIVADWVPLSAFSGFAIDEFTIQKVGLFDEYYYPGCGEEINYWSRAHRNGITAVNVPFAFNLQGHIGRTRKSLQDRFPRTSAITANNIALGVANQDRLIGWDLQNRRRSDPTLRYTPTSDRWKED